MIHYFNDRIITQCRYCGGQIIRFHDLDVTTFETPHEVCACSPTTEDMEVLGYGVYDESDM